MLKSKMTALASLEITSDVNTVHGKTEADFLVGMKREILETRLARRLEFTNDCGLTLVFQVKASRVQILTSPTSDTLIESFPDMLNFPLSEDDSAATAKCAEIAQRFVKSSAHLAVRRTAIDKARASDQIGISPHWLFDLPDKQEKQPEALVLDHVFDRLSKDAVGVVYLTNGKTTSMTGDPEVVRSLMQLASAEITRADPDENANQFAFFRSSAPDAPTLYSARFSSALIFGLTKVHAANVINEFKLAGLLSD